MQWYQYITKSTDCARKIHDMIKLAKEGGCPLTVIVFEGEMVTPLGLLQELHSCLTLSLHRDPHTWRSEGGAKEPCVLLPYLCTYMVKNDYSFLNHIIVRHYWSSFSCGKCLKLVATNGQQMKRHIQTVGSPRKSTRKSIPKTTKRLEVQSSSKSGHKSKKVKKNKTDKEGVSTGGTEKATQFTIQI